MGRDDNLAALFGKREQKLSDQLEPPGVNAVLRLLQREQ